MADNTLDIYGIKKEKNGNRDASIHEMGPRLRTQRAAFADGRSVWSELGQTITKDYSYDVLCLDPGVRKGVRLAVDRLSDVVPRVEAGAIRCEVPNPEVMAGRSSRR